MFISNYPTKKVLMSFSLFTGLLSGLLVGVPMWIRATLQGDGFGQLALPFAMVAGGIGGIIPSFLLGIYLSKIRFRLINGRSWIKLFGIGLGFSLLAIALLPVTETYFVEGYKLLIIGLITSLVYSISVLIIGKLVLPKEKIYGNY